jgi:predicted dehydrogenase
MLEQKDLDAVVIATPDHWHAIQTVDACNAGKDVYVEKPVSMTVFEGRKMVEVARRTKRVVQVGLHRRSSDLYAEVAKRVQADLLGKVTVCRCYHLSNMYPTGMGKAEPSAPPPGLDWDMWLGPRPMEPFRETIAPYKFRWWMLYSSQIANNGVHHLDVIRWMTGDGGPVRIAALGGRYAVDDDRTIPDTMQAILETGPGRLVLFGQYEANGNPALPHPGHGELRGTQGTAYLSDSVVRVIPERGGQFQDRQPRMEPMEFKAADFQSRGPSRGQSVADGAARRRFPRLHAHPRDAQVRHRDRAHLDHVRVAGQHRPGDRQHLGVGPGQGAIYQQRGG